MKTILSLILILTLMLSGLAHAPASAVCAAPASAAFATPVAASFSTIVPAGRESAIVLQGSDADGTPLTYAIASSPSHGSLANLNASTGVVVYTPAAGYTGADSFTYTVTSGGDTSPAGTVTLTVSNSKTRIVDTVVNSSGTPRKGTITFVLTQPVTSPAGLVPAGASVSAQLNSAGQFDLSVFPSRSLQPAAYYQVWFTDSTTLKQELIGIYDIPFATNTITLAAYKVTDTALAARYTFASEAAVSALILAASTATLATLTTINLGSDATGDLYYRNSGGGLARLPIGSSGQVLTVGSGGLPVWAAASGGSESPDVPDPDNTYGSLLATVIYDLNKRRGTAESVSSLGDGLQFQYKLADATDSGPNGLNLTNNNAVTFGTGLIGNAGIFNSASSQYLSRANSSAFDFLTTGSWTIGFSFWLDDNTGHRTVIGKTGVPDTMFIRFNNTPNRMQAAIYNGSSYVVATAENFGAVPQNTWKTGFAWYDSSAGQVCIEIQRGTPNCTATAAPPAASTEIFTIGANRPQYGETAFWSGKLDNIAGWNRLLTTGERDDFCGPSCTGNEGPFTTGGGGGGIGSTAVTAVNVTASNLGENGHSTTVTSGVVQANGLSLFPFATPATSITVSGYNTFNSVNESQVGIKVNGRRYQALTSSTTGNQTWTVTLPAGYKTVELISSAKGTGDGIGNFLKNVSFGSSTGVPVKVSTINRLFIDADSIGQGIGASVPVFEGWTALLRDHWRGSVMVEGWAGRQLYDIAGDSTKRSNQVAYVTAQNPSVYILDLMVNDWQQANWSASAFGTGLAAYLDALHTAAPSLKIYVKSAIVAPNETSANSAGSTLPDYRSAEATVCSSRTWVTCVDGSVMLTLSDLTGLHPHTRGHAKLEAAWRPILGH